MNKAIPLSDYGKENIEGMKRGLDANLYPLPKNVHRKLILNLILEAAVAYGLYYKYTVLLQYHRLLAPALMGAATATAAQSINQIIKKKLSYNKIAKFFVWGLINGTFTELWLELLILRFHSSLVRILIDQAIGAPFFQGIFNILSTLWDHGEITANTKAIYLKSLKYSYCYWPFFSVLSFVFIPQSWLFFSNCLANLLWSLVLAKLT